MARASCLTRRWSVWTERCEGLRDRCRRGLARVRRVTSALVKALLVKLGGRVPAPVRRIRGCVQVVWWWILGADTAETSSCGSCCRPGRLLKIRPPRGRRGFAAGVDVACAY